MTCGISLLILGFKRACMIEPTVSAGYVTSLLDVAVAKGADRKALLAAAGIDEAGLEDPDTRHPFERFKTMMRTAKVMLNDPAFALHFGATLLFKEMSIVGMI